jgi:hypothetical protein
MHKMYLRELLDTMLRLLLAMRRVKRQGVHSLTRFVVEGSRVRRHAIEWKLLLLDWLLRASAMSSIRGESPAAHGR